MKKIIVFVFIIFLFLPQVVYANGAGLPPFFKINGKYSQSNPLQLYGITAQSFLLPQDFAPENYVVNQPITFRVDQSQLATVIPSNMLVNTKYVWDYGDGSNKADGLTHTHTYKKIGSYILILTINLSTGQNEPPTQFIDSYLLNILPSIDYQGLPHAVIKIGGKKVNGALSFNPVKLNYNYPVSFDASSSKSTSSLTQYLWNFGDGQTGTQPIMQHIYKQKGQAGYDYDVVVLRVKDKNGFISDSYIALNNDPTIKNNEFTGNQNTSFYLEVILFSTIIVVVLLIISAFAVKWRKKKSQ